MVRDGLLQWCKGSTARLLCVRVMSVLAKAQGAQNDGNLTRLKLCGTPVYHYLNMHFVHAAHMWPLHSSMRVLGLPRDDETHRVVMLFHHLAAAPQRFH